MTSVTGSSRLGILGGTFDPPHIGHLVAALSAREQLGLDEVWLVPAGDPWQKRGTRTITPTTIRLEMVRSAVAGVPGVSVSDIEVEREGPSYTIDTVTALRADDPHRGIVLVMGRDAAAGLDTWHRHDELLTRCSIAVVDRVGAPPFEAAVVGARVEEVVMPRLDVSSTDLRARVASGRGIDVLVPAGAVAVIARESLYRSPPS